MAKEQPRKRQQVGLRRPRTGDADGIPRVSATDVWHRCVAVRHDQPWWFSTRTDNPAPGRFDLEEPDGTCYLAASAVAALVETLADPDAETPIRPTIEELQALRVWSGDLEGPPEVADTTVLSLPGVTEELNSVTPYELPWAWVDEISNSGAEGLVYTARFGRERALALFGPASRPMVDAGQEIPTRGDMEPTPALEYVTDLPAILRPGSVGNHDDFEAGPPP